MTSIPNVTHHSSTGQSVAYIALFFFGIVGNPQHFSASFFHHVQHPSMETVFYIRSSLYELSTKAAFSSFRTLHTQHIQRFLSWERFSRHIILLRLRTVTTYSIPSYKDSTRCTILLHTITSFEKKQSTICSIPLFSERGALSTLLFSAENSMPRTTFFFTLLFIYLLLCSIVQYPSLLVHYASQRIFLAIRVRWHTIHSIRNKKYTAFRFGIPPYRQHFITFILHHLYWNLNPLQHCFRQGTVHPIQDFFPSIRLYHIFSSILCF
jgi:hypothetical protein